MCGRQIMPVCILALTLATIGGCGGASFGTDARVPVADRLVIRGATPAEQGIRLPQDRGFNIHVKQSSQNLGAAGSAKGHSDATPQGLAFAEALASQGGSAKAQFKIGHRIDNHSDVVQTMAAQIRFQLEQRLSASEPPAPATQAKAELLLVIIDSRKRVVSKVVVLQADSDESRGNASLPQRRDLVARLEPGESYDIVLFAQVEACASEAQESSVRLDVDRLEMELEFSPVTTQPAAPHASVASPTVCGSGCNADASPVFSLCGAGVRPVDAGRHAWHVSRVLNQD